MIEYKSGEELGFMKKSPHSPECVSSIIKRAWRNMLQNMFVKKIEKIF
jgi:hypothetical protein